MQIKFNNVSYIYQPGTPYESQGLDDVSFTIEEGSYTAIVGHTGSGKSTILQHLNGLLQATSGNVEIGDTVIDSNTSHQTLRQIRQQVGLVFQFPESQLFEETVVKDAAFGPKNFGMSEDEALAIAREKLRLVGLDKSFDEQSPFELSGGQMRRVAIAGVLAMNPKVLVLDEPTAGLDPVGRLEMMRLFKQLNDSGMTIVLVTHQMDDVANFADHVIVMEKGKCLLETNPVALFSNQDWLIQHHLSLPKAVQFYQLLKKGGFPVEENPITIKSLSNVIIQSLKGE